jgi:hypothetical protein
MLVFFSSASNRPFEGTVRQDDLHEYISNRLRGKRPDLLSRPGKTVAAERLWDVSRDFLYSGNASWASVVYDRALALI